MNMDLRLLKDVFASPETATQLSLPEWETLILILRHAGVLSQMRYRLEREGIYEHLPDYARCHLNNAWILSEKQRKQVDTECMELDKTLSGHTRFCVFLKGAAYTLIQNSAARGRTYSDIDLLVDKESLSQAERVLSVWGWMGKSMDDYDDRYYRQWAHEIPPMQHAGRGTVLDLHHNLVPPVSGKAPDIRLFVKDAVTIAGHGQVLRPAAMTLHSAIHLFFDEDFKHGFRDLYDLHCLLTDYRSDEFWKDILELANNTDFERELYLALRFTQWFFHTRVPKHVCETLGQRIGVNGFQLKLWDWMFKRVLLPHHPRVGVKFQGLAISLALIRGHCLKMPLRVLLRHSLTKFWRHAIGLVLGKNYHDEQESPKG